MRREPPASTQPVRGVVENRVNAVALYRKLGQPIFPQARLEEVFYGVPLAKSSMPYMPCVQCDGEGMIECDYECEHECRYCEGTGHVCDDDDGKPIEIVGYAVIGYAVIGYAVIGYAVIFGSDLRTRLVYDSRESAERSALDLAVQTTFARRLFAA